MSKERYELWLCDDCVVLIETGDASSLDYHYDSLGLDDEGTTEADRRLSEIERGIKRLTDQGDLFNDNSEEVQLECSYCGHIIMQADAEYVLDEWEESVPVCPACKGLEMRTRGSGHDEFSRAGCDCCYSTLAGSLTRYSLVVDKEKV